MTIDALKEENEKLEKKLESLQDFINERPNNEPPLDWWLKLYDLLEVE